MADYPFNFLGSNSQITYFPLDLSLLHICQRQGIVPPSDNEIMIHLYLKKLRSITYCPFSPFSAASATLADKGLSTILFMIPYNDLCLSMIIMVHFYFIEVNQLPSFS